MYDFTTIGRCSLCDGPVRVPKVSASSMHTVAVCAHCDAQAMYDGLVGPVIPMRHVVYFVRIPQLNSASTLEC